MEKKKYCKPCIEKIALDSEISLALESVIPPEGPGEGALLAPEYLIESLCKSPIA